MKNIFPSRGCPLNCGNWVGGFTPPVVIEHLANAVHAAIGTGRIGEEIVHRAGAAAHLPRGPLQDIGGPDGLPPQTKHG